MREMRSCESGAMLKIDTRALFSFKNECLLICKYLKAYLILFISEKKEYNFRLIIKLSELFQLVLEICA